MTTLKAELEFLKIIYKKITSARSMMTEAWDRAGLGFIEGAVESRITVIESLLNQYVETD